MSEKLKICIISFDNWHYDNQIIKALERKKIITHHINLGKYKHKNILQRSKNAFYKLFFNKNLKFQKRQEFIIESLTKFGFQDHILVLNPDLIELNFHYKIKQHTKNYMVYLYDSIARSKYPIEHLLEGIFDVIYSFDNDDVLKYNFKKIDNYIYLDKKKNEQKSTFKVMTVSSFDKRFPLFNKIANQLSEFKFSFEFIFVSKNILYKVLKYKLITNDKINGKIKFQSKKVSLEEVKSLYNKSDIILDLVQGYQTGLSFRVFESMALQKKLITNNSNIINFDFYNPNNILVIDSDINFDSSFFITPYEPIPDAIYKKYTLENWVDTIFELKSRIK